MAFNTPLPKNETYIFGRGILYLALFDALGNPLGERDLGNTPGFTLSVATTRFTHTSSRTGQALTDYDIPIATALSAKIDIEDMSAENQALFIAGSVTEIDQASGTVTAERVRNVQGGREYQLGATGGNPSGVRGVTSVAVKSFENGAAASRVNSTPYEVGDVFKSTTNVFLVTVAGTVAASPPTYNTTAVGDATADGTATVAYIGTTTQAFVLGTDYTVSTESARVGVIVGGLLDTIAGLFPTDSLPSLAVDYTKVANSRVQIVSSGAGSTTGQLRFISDNAGSGVNRDMFIASCSVSASGDNPWITDNAIGKFSLDIGINAKDSSTPQIIIDGRPVAA